MEKTNPKITIPPPEVLAQNQRAADHEAMYRFAREMRYDRRRREFRFVLNSGVTVAIPLAMIGYGFPGLTESQLGRVRLDNIGGGIELRELDWDLSVPGIIRDALGFGELQQHRAGRARSPAKSAASRANGAKGGRPRKFRRNAGMPTSLPRPEVTA